MSAALLTLAAGIPHASVKDDIYEGYHIPAGSVMHPLEWSISRDPEVFHDPDVWNPMRWLENKYPTYQEPLTKFPTITGYSQFGYGRRTCQGMGVTEADLFVGLGSMAWMFSMHADTEDVEDEAEANETFTKHVAEQKCLHVQSANARPRTPPNEEEIAHELSGKGHGVSIHQKNDSAISLVGDVSEKLNTHIQHMPGNPSKLAGRPGLPSVKSMFGAPPSPTASDVSFDDLLEKHTTKPKAAHNPSNKADTNKTANDPTMEFSTLLIAKPKPFKFNLKIRDQEKADRIARKWMELKMDGEFEDSRVFWKNGNKGDQQHGWGEVFG
jgi:hypothetical protein